MTKRNLSAWDLVDEVLTDLSDINFEFLPKDRIGFRNALIEEVKQYLIDNPEITVVDEEIETEEVRAEHDQLLRQQEWDYRHA